MKEKSSGKIKYIILALIVVVAVTALSIGGQYKKEYASTPNEESYEAEYAEGDDDEYMEEEHDTDNGMTGMMNGSEMGEMGMMIKMSELKQRSNRDNCWLAVDGKVYDVASFVDNHPGGELILKGCGKDATSDFMEYHAGELDEVLEMLPKFYIGELEANSDANEQG